MKEDQELELLRKLYEECRGILRYHGVDSKRCAEYFNKMSDSVQYINEFNNGN